MPRIFDSIDQQLLPALWETLDLQAVHSKPIIDKIDRLLAEH